MRKDEVPQDNSSTYAGHKKVLYAHNESGTYTKVQSTGWDVEAAATLDAVDLYNELARDALKEVQAGKKSPLYYHMYQCRMDPPLLSQVAGVWRWRLGRHFRPGPFRRLPQAILQRYADALDLSIDQLTQVPDSE